MRELYFQSLIFLCLSHFYWSYKHAHCQWLDFRGECLKPKCAACFWNWSRKDTCLRLSLLLMLECETSQVDLWPWRASLTCSDRSCLKPLCLSLKVQPLLKIPDLLQQNLLGEHVSHQWKTWGLKLPKILSCYCGMWPCFSSTSYCLSSHVLVYL